MTGTVRNRGHGFCHSRCGPSRAVVRGGRRTPSVRAGSSSAAGVPGGHRCDAATEPGDDRPLPDGGRLCGGQPAPASAATTPPRTGADVTTSTPTGSPNDETRIGEMERSLPSHFYRRPAHRKLGRPIQLVANHFSIEIPDGNVVHYDVEIYCDTSAGAKVPEQGYRCLSTKVSRLVTELLVGKYRHDLSNCIPAFDGRKNLYTRRQLSFRERTFSAELNGDQRMQKFLVKVQHAAAVNLGALHAVYQNRVNSAPQELLQLAIDIVVRHGPSMEPTPVGLSLGAPPPHEPNGGGYDASVRPAWSKPVPDAGASATAFYESLPLMRKISGDSRREMAPADFKTLRDFHHARLNKGLRVKVTHLPCPRKYTVVRVTKESAKEIFFDEDGKRTSVAEYFEKRYSRLAYPHFPCVQSGSVEQPVHIPLEVHELVEHCRKKLDENHTAEMIERTAKQPAKRFQEIRQSVRDLVNSAENYLREFDIKISTDSTQLKGRVLEPPSLVLENDSPGEPREGTWELRGQHFSKPTTMDRWTLVSPSRFAQRDHLDNFVKVLMRIGLELGKRIDQALEISAPDHNRRSIRSILGEQQHKRSKLRMVVVVIAKTTSYAEVEQVAETELGLRTQCLLGNSVVEKCNEALVQNLCQKINARMGGSNNSLLAQEKPALFQKPVVTIGADVSHPSPGDKIRPSIAACVGRLDSTPSKFHAAVRIQMEHADAKARVEITKDLKEMMKDMLKAFLGATKHKPERIIFYRDGVSEGQFLEVRNRDVRASNMVSAIRLARKELSPNESYEPARAFVVVRHRFVPTTVAHPPDLFLDSHSVVQGTSRPTNYYIVWDDSNFTADELQKLSYYLCHTYARCARSVSIPAPECCAHLAALRAKNHALSEVGVPGSSSGSSGGSGDNVATSQYVEAVRVLGALQTSMYFV
ncbi:protein argonaute-2-like isoform X2 [Dermacentor albipictus]|uniref:protein argonaute-2-like isoform X2 n=1 Tax=Dermacentor albipictus TaxID=60249 RepID=UPI0038FC3C92